MLESIERYRHLFLATYTVHGDDGWHGYTKICPDKPTSVWDTGFTFRKITSGPWRAEMQSHDEAVASARAYIDAIFNTPVEYDPDGTMPQLLSVSVRVDSRPSAARA